MQVKVRFVFVNLQFYLVKHWKSYGFWRRAEAFLEVLRGKHELFKKNMHFTCIRAMLGACYAGKSSGSQKQTSILPA